MNKYIYIKETGQVAGPLQMEEPDFKSADWFSPFEQWVNHLELLPRIDIVGEHSFLDGQILEIGKDIQIDRWYGNRFRAAITTSNYSLSAIPLKQVQKEKDFEPGARSINDAFLASHSSGSGNSIEEAAEDYAALMVWINKGHDNEQEFYEYISKASFKAGAEWAGSQEDLLDQAGVIRGNDAIRFREQMEENKKKKVSPEELARIKKAAEEFKAITKPDSQEVKGNATQQGPYTVYFPMDNDFGEFATLKEIETYVNSNYCEDGDIHPDIESITIYKKVGGVWVEETGETVERYGDTVPVADVQVYLDEQLPNSEQGVAQREPSVATNPNQGTEPSPQNSFTEEDLLELIRYCAEKDVHYAGVKREFIYTGAAAIRFTPKEVLTNFLKQQKGA